LFEGIAGLILCDFSEIEPEPEFDVTELLKRLTDGLGVPTGYGFSVGHGAQTTTLPIGTQTRFNSKEGTLELLESPVL
jgi:muramoyltetrapeptide carboxypeptidase LdcA involved in peptidoglycan recycling